MVFLQSPVSIVRNALSVAVLVAIPAAMLLLLMLLLLLLLLNHAPSGDRGRRGPAGGSTGHHDNLLVHAKTRQ